MAERARLCQSCREIEAREARGGLKQRPDGAWNKKTARPYEANNPASFNMVNAIFTTFIGSRETARRYDAPMDAPFISGRLALADAADLIERFGEDAAAEAAARARRSRGDGNIARFCHWRQIERVIATLSCGEVIGTVH